MNLEIAKTSEAEVICKLINQAYRGVDGWTTENDLVEGDRCSEAAIISDIQSPDNYVLVYKDKEDIQACISVQNIENSAYIGSFAVSPDLQNSGIGKAVLNLAEKFAISQFQPEKFKMVVLSSRIELIEYYERRGYQRNGIINKYPLHLNVGIPKQSDLTIEELTKNA